jgi:hypothetical protein
MAYTSDPAAADVMSTVAEVAEVLMRVDPLESTAVAAWAARGCMASATADSVTAKTRVASVIASALRNVCLSDLVKREDQVLEVEIRQAR